MGFPLTVQRRVILETMLLRDDHPTAEQIYDALQAQVPEISRATVYRALESWSSLVRSAVPIISARRPGSTPTPAIIITWSACGAIG